MDELELDLIDAGLDTIDLGDENDAIVYCAFTDFGAMQKALEAKNIEVLEAKLTRLPTTTVTLNKEQHAEFQKLLDRLEEDEDVQEVFHNMVEEGEDEE